MIRNATKADIEGILEIYNDAILNTTAVYTYTPLTKDMAASWYDEKVRNNWPILVESENGKIAGFATFGAFRDWPAYQYTIEHSIYVHKDYRGRGLATKLMRVLLHRADIREYATVVAGIDSDNNVSIALHERLGFKEVGLIKKAGYKFGRWLNLSFYQLDLTGPSHPIEK